MNSYTCTHKKYIQNKHLSPHMYCCCCSVTKSCPTLYDPMDCNTPGFPVLHYLVEVCSNSCPLSQWCHPAISSSVTTFSSCPQSFPGCWPSVVSDSLQSQTWTAAHQASLSFNISRSLLKLMSIESVMPSNHFTLCHPLLLLPSIFPSIRVFSNELALCIRWPKYWSFSISPPMSIQGWFPLGLTGLTPSSPRDSQESSPTPHFERINSSVLSILYGPTLTSIYDYQKNYSFHIWTFVRKMMSLLFHMLSRVVIAFLPRSKHLLILWLKSLGFWAQENKLCHCFHFFCVYLP